MSKRVKDPKPAFQLYRHNDVNDYVPVGVWVCGECGTIYGSGGEEQATNCCKVRVCECGKDIIDNYGYYTACESCRDEAAKKREAERWEKMPYFDNYLQEAVFDGDYFHSSLWDYLDGHDDGEGGIPEEYIHEFLEVCDIRKFGDNLDPDSVIDEMLERARENIEDGEDYEFVGEEEFKKQIREFLDKQPGEFWMPIGKKIDVRKEAAGSAYKIKDKEEE